MNLYEILHISQDAPEEIIKLAYKGLAQKYHPDRYKGADANEKMVQIREAYETLIDPIKRKNYDQFLAEQARRKQQQEEYVKQQQQEEFVRRQKAAFEQQNKANSSVQSDQSIARSNNKAQNNSSFKMDISINISNYFSIFLLFKKLKEWFISILNYLMAPSPAKNYQPNSTEQSKNEQTSSTKKFLESFKIFAITFVSVICLGIVIIATIQPKNIESPTIEPNTTGGYNGGTVAESTTTTEENFAVNNYDENYVSEGWTAASEAVEAAQEAELAAHQTMLAAQEATMATTDFDNSMVIDESEKKRMFIVARGAHEAVTKFGLEGLIQVINKCYESSENKLPCFYLDIAGDLYDESHVSVNNGNPNEFFSGENYSQRITENFYIPANYSAEEAKQHYQTHREEFAKILVQVTEEN